MTSVPPRFGAGVALGAALAVALVLVPGEVAGAAHAPKRIPTAAKITEIWRTIAPSPR
jgi:hypothetical protein